MRVFLYLRSEKVRSRIRAVQMDNLRSSLSIRRVNKIPNARVRELVGVKRGMDERTDKSVFWWFGLIEGIKFKTEDYCKLKTLNEINWFLMQKD